MTENAADHAGSLAASGGGTNTAGAELVTLFGDELAEVRPARIGMTLAGGAKVSMRDVAQMLLALSVVQLLEQGAATLSEQETKKLFRTRRTMLLQATPAGAGFTKAVSETATETIAIDDLTSRLLGGMVATPEIALIRLAQSQLERSGAVVRSDTSRSRRLGTKLGANPYEIQQQQAEELRPEWQRLRERWEHWKAADPGLAQRLIESSRASVSNAKQPID